MVRYLFYTIGDLTYQSPLVYFGTRPLGTPRTCEYNIKTILREIGLGGDAWSWLKFMTSDSLRNKRCLMCCKRVPYTLWAAYLFQ